MSRPRQFQMVGGGGSNPEQYNDTTFTKIFVGGLAWETQRDTMRRYFEQFGEILGSVVISDKNTGRSKGYGFVTFKDPEAATRACQNPSPVIDGRRANCNLASLGAQKLPRPPTPHQHGAGRFRSTIGLVASAPPYHGSSSSSSSSSSIQHPPSQCTFHYSAYGYAGYSADTMYPLNYYGVYGGQQFSPYCNTGASGTTGMFQNFYPFYTIYPQSSQQARGFGVQYPPVAQYPYMPLVYNSTGGILSLPSQLAIQSTTTGEVEIYNTTGATTMTTTTTATMATTIAQPQRPPLPSIPSSSISTTGVVGARTAALQASGSASESNLSTK